MFRILLFRNKSGLFEHCADETVKLSPVAAFISFFSLDKSCGFKCQRKEWNCLGCRFDFARFSAATPLNFTEKGCATLKTIMARRNNIKNFLFQVSFAEASGKRPILFLAAALVVFGFSSTAAFSQSKNSAAATTTNSVGKYDFEDVGSRRSRNELIPSIYYVLELSKNKKNGAINCNFYATGFQTNQEYQCSVKEAANKLSIYFEKDLIHTSNEDIEFVRFKKGQLLFSLSKSQAGKATRYQFRPAGYDIVLLNDKKKAIYFSKTK